MESNILCLPLFEISGINNFATLFNNEYLIFRGDIMAKPRMTRKDKWEKRVCTAKYWSFKDKLILEANRCNFKINDAFEFFAFIKMPDSWSNKKKNAMLLQKHSNKPDTDNILKSVNDIFGKTDEARWSNTGHKFWFTENILFIRNKTQQEIDIIELQAKTITEFILKQNENNL